MVESREPAPPSPEEPRPLGRMRGPDAVSEIIRTAMDGFYIADLSGRILEVNDAYCAMSGYERLELIGKNVADIEAVESGSEIAAHIAEIVGAGSDRFETRHRRIDGSVFDIEVSVHYVAEDGGVLFSFMRDITLQKEAEREACRTEARLAALVGVAEHAAPTSEGLLHFALEQALTLTQSTLGCVHLVEGTGHELALVAHIGEGGAAMHAPRAAAASCKAWRSAIEHRTAVIVNDAATEGRCRLPSCDATLESFAAVPVLADDEVKAVVSVANSPQGYTDGDGRQLMLFMQEVWKLLARRQAEDALRQTRDELEATLNALPDTLVEVDVDGLVHAVRAPVPEGVSEESRLAVGRRLAEVLPADVERAIMDAVRDAARLGRSRSSEYALDLGVDRRWFELTAAAKGKLPATRVIVVIREITERKRAEAAQRRAAELLTEAQAVARVGSYTYSFSSDRWTGSQVLDEIYGIDAGYPRDLEGWSRIVHPDDRAELVLYFREQIDKGKSFEREYRIRRIADGVERWVFDRGDLVRDDAGAVCAIHGIVQDVTERKSAEARRLQLEEQLVHAQKLESVGRLAGGVAHDINNMLTPILGYARLMEMELPSAHPHRASVAEIGSAAGRIRDLTRQLLAFARRQTLQMRPLDLNRVVASFENMLRRTLREDIEIVTRLAATPLSCHGDARQLEQIILNLAVNAQDAMPKGGRLELRTAAVELDGLEGHDGAEARGPFVMLEVGDSGIGMSAETLGKIFEPFFTTKELGRGTGLGLSTVYGIIKQHGGLVRVTSAVGVGTTFRVYFPETRMARAAEPESAPARRATGSETVLVVEDQPDVLRLAARILERHGYTVLTAGGGVEALQVLSGRPAGIDLLLCDVVMPDIDGRELYERARKLWPSLAVLFMSGYVADVISTEGLLDPGVQLVEKPFSVEGLTRKVREVLDSREREASGGGSQGALAGGGPVPPARSVAGR